MAQNENLTYDILAVKVLELMEQADIRRINAKLAAIFEVNTSFMKCTIDRMMRAGTVVCTRHVKGHVYFAAKWDTQSKELPNRHVFTGHPHRVSVLGNRPGSNDYRDWPSRFDMR